VKERLIITGYKLSDVVLMVSFDDQTERSRPFEVDIKFNGRSVDCNVVGSQDGGDLLAEGTLLIVVNLVLEMLETHSEFCVASSSTISIAFESFTAISINVTGVIIIKFFQAKLEDSLGPRFSGI